jgi:transposase
MACERIRQELEKTPTKTAAFKAVAEEMGLSPQTVRTWHYRAVSNETGHRKSRSEPKSKRVSKLNPTDKEVVVSEEFRAAFEAMRGAIQNAKAENWKATSQQAALHYLDILVDVVTVK